MKNHPNTQSGFTLVEIAIVLIVIGLLIAGVLRGQEMIRNARITATIEQVQAYRSALVNFVDHYHNYPGDMTNASKRIPGCNTAPCNIPGNGNGIVGDVSPEQNNFWVHLAAAKYITGISDYNNPKPRALGTATGAFYPGSLWMNGKVQLVLDDYAGNDNGVLTPHQAHQIDTKMDDGLPMTGEVQARMAAGDEATTDCMEGTTLLTEHYNDAQELNNSCNLYFNLDN